MLTSQNFCIWAFAELPAPLAGDLAIDSMIKVSAPFDGGHFNPRAFELNLSYEFGHKLNSSVT